MPPTVGHFATLMAPVNSTAVGVRPGALMTRCSEHFWNTPVPAATDAETTCAVPATPSAMGALTGLNMSMNPMRRSFGCLEDYP